MSIAVHQDNGRYTPQYAVIDTAVNDTTLVAAQTGKKIRVYSYTVVATAAVTVRFESGTGGTALTGQMSLGIGGVVSVQDPLGLFETAESALLNLELGGLVSVDGHLTWAYVD